MRDIRHAALVVAEHDVRVMIFAVRHPRRGVDEGGGLIIIFEVIGLADHAVVERPAIELLEQPGGFIGGERRHATFAVRAFAFGKVSSSHVKNINKNK